ncbi:MAG: NACHT domain-containing protein [Cyanobacteria bacterium P01_F01_bin.33]
MEWLTVWGVTAFSKFVFTEIIGKLAKDAGEGYVKDFFSQSIKDIVDKLQNKPEPLQKAMGQAVAQLLYIVQEELENCELSESEIKPFETDLGIWIDQDVVKRELGKAFGENQHPDARELRLAWKGRLLPDEFDWELAIKNYVRAVRKIRRESDELRAVLDSESLAAMQEALGELVGPTTDFDLNRYAEGLREQYGNLKLESLDTTGYAYNEMRLWRMFVPQSVREIYDYVPQVYELSKEELKKLREEGELDEEALREYELEARRKQYVQQPIRPVLEVTGDVGTTLMVVLGDPGSGKSTLLQYLALNWAELPARDRDLAPIPLLVELRTFARNMAEGKCGDILEFFARGDITCHLNQMRLKTALDEGRAIALLDGLDEVFDPKQRQDVVTAIHNFSNRFARVRALVTSRPIGYKFQRLKDAGFQHFMLQDLDAEQIDTFIGKWHELTYKPGMEREQKRERLRQGIGRSGRIRELAENPLLLTMMAILNRNQELPRDRAELYNQASRVLLHRWDVERAIAFDDEIPTTIDYKDKQAMLERLASHMQASEVGLKGNLVGTDDLERILTDYLKFQEVDRARDRAKRIIRQLRERNFILCFVGAERYAFVHRTFLEYFCATAFVEQFEKQRTLSEDDLIELFKQHWQDESWHEVLRLISGLVGESVAAKAIAYLMNRYWSPDEPEALILASECLSEVRNRTMIQSIGLNLFRKMQHLATYDLEEKQAESVLDTIAITWAARIDVPSWLQSCIFRRSNDDFSYPYVAENAVRTIAQNRLLGDATRLWLQHLTDFTDFGDRYAYAVRFAAVQELARGWKEDPEVLEILKQRARADDNYAVRRAAVQELARGWKEDPEVLEFLKQLEED